MCTLVIDRAPGHDWPILVAANRDEMQDRPWKSPGRHWPDRPHVVAGQDLQSDGAWMGVNDDGLMAAVLNRYGSLGPSPDRRSRGELVLEALDHAEATAAADALADLDPHAYRSFNLVVADALDAFWIRHSDAEDADIEVFPLPPGLSMLSAFDLNDTSSGRIRRYLPRFRAATRPDPENNDWQEWQSLLAATEVSSGEKDSAAMCFSLENGFGTLSSSLLALPDIRLDSVEAPRSPVWIFAPGRPDQTDFQPVNLEE